MGFARRGRLSLAEQATTMRSGMNRFFALLNSYLRLGLSRGGSSFAMPGLAGSDEGALAEL